MNSRADHGIVDCARKPNFYSLADFLAKSTRFDRHRVIVLHEMVNVAADARQHKMKSFKSLADVLFRDIHVAFMQVSTP